MPTEISWEIRERAEGLYIIDGLTYEQTAERTGVSATQLKRWGADGAWGERRAEYRRELSDIRRGTVQLRAKLLRKVLDTPSPDPQDVYAFARIEQVAAAAAAKTQPEPQGSAIAEGAEQRVIRTPEDAVAALGDALQKKINAMLNAADGIDLAGIKEVKQCMELIEKMKTQMAPEGGADPSERALDAKTIRSIREQLSL
jgi:hypothetical protein